jgi:uncharacterized membrane-anchored protein
MMTHSSSPTKQNKQLDKNCSALADEEQGNDASSTSSLVNEVILKIPHLTIIYWCEKMTATTFGETFADFFTQTLGFGYTSTSMILISVFLVFLAMQIKVKTYWPVLFWAVMASSSVAGTCISDFIDRTLKWGYPLGMGVLLSILLGVVSLWKLSGEHMSVEGAMTRKAEAFYWTTILVSNTLGTALGDFMSDSLSLGFGASAGIIGGLLCILAFLAYFSKVSRVVLFWIAFVLTRPFGATFGDLLTKSEAEGGLDLGTLNASMVILGLFLISFFVEMYELRKNKLAKDEVVAAQKEVQTNTNTNENVEHDGHAQSEGQIDP